jgi:hypothetical protein
VKRFKKIFEEAKDTIVYIGDWEQRIHREFKEPTKWIGFSNMFRKSGFQIYLVDEIRTSHKCSKCEGSECSKFREIRNSIPTKNNSFMSHGHLLCKKDCELWFEMRIQQGLFTKQQIILLIKKNDQLTQVVPNKTIVVFLWMANYNVIY